MNPEKYKSFTLTDFAEDKIFIDWVLNQDEDVNDFWESFLHKYPEKREELYAARKLILSSIEVLALEKLSQEEKSFMNQQILKGIQTQKSGKLRIRERVIPMWASWAAVILLLFALGVGLYVSQNQTSQLTYQTAYGEIKSFELPDGSLVKLHANSYLTFDEAWGKGEDREVWLRGEAYFDVEKKPSTQAKFSVHTSDLKVEVLGTEFNVDTRKEKTEVVLNEGKIKLQLEDKANKTILMEPGDLVSYSHKENKLAQTKTDPHIRSSWKEGVQQFNKSPLPEVMSKIEEIYGIRIEIDDPALFDRRLTIGIPVESLEIALATLENILGKRIAPTTENQFKIK